MEANDYGPPRRVRAAFGNILSINYTFAVPDGGSEALPSAPRYDAPQQVALFQRQPPPLETKQIQVQQYVGKNMILPYDTIENEKNRRHGCSPIFPVLLFVSLALIAASGYVMYQYIQHSTSRAITENIDTVQLTSDNFNGADDLVAGNIIITTHLGPLNEEIVVIDSTDFGPLEGAVICSQVGGRNAGLIGVSRQNLFRSKACPSYKLTNMKCTGTEASISGCSFSVKRADCSDIFKAAGVACRLNKPLNELKQQMTILLDGANEFEGNLYAAGEDLVLGPVCDTGFGHEEAISVCRDMGFDGAQFIAYGSYFGPVKGAFALTQLSCNAKTTTLDDCYWSTHANCLSNTGAGVVCEE